MSEPGPQFGTGGAVPGRAEQAQQPQISEWLCDKKRKKEEKKQRISGTVIVWALAIDRVS